MRSRRAPVFHFLAALAASLACAHAARAAGVTVAVADPAGRPLADAVVTLEPVGARVPVKPMAGAQVEQVDRHFVPQVSVVTVGTPVSFPNHDTVRHHVYSFSATKTFDIKLYAGTPARPEVFDKPGVATLGCNIHDRMSAHIVVVDTPLFAKSDADGWVRMDLPAGQHRLLFWHPKLDGPALRSKPLSVTPDTAPLQLTLEFAD